MGSGVVFSQLYGEGNMDKLKTAMTNAFCPALRRCPSWLTVLLSYALLDAFIVLLRVLPEAVPDITSYLRVIFAGIFTLLYNFFAAALAASAICLRLCCFCCFHGGEHRARPAVRARPASGAAGAALATVIAQGFPRRALRCISSFSASRARPRRSNFRADRPLLSRIASVSVLTRAQQSIMNFVFCSCRASSTASASQRWRRSRRA